jgi:hypothetical protein
VATSPIVRPRAGGIVGSTVPTTVVWRGTDNLSGWAISSLQQQRNGGTWSTIGSGLTAKSLNRALAPGLTTYALRVRGTDKAGNTGAWAAGPTVNLAVAPQTNAAIKYGGTWTSLGAASYLGGSAMTAYSTTAFATIRFTGRGFAWVGKYAASCGSAKVWVDGVLKATVSSYRTMTAYRPIIWSIAWSTSATHTIVIRPADTAGHPRIVLDGIVIVR